VERVGASLDLKDASLALRCGRFMAAASSSGSTPPVVLSYSFFLSSPFTPFCLYPQWGGFLPSPVIGTKFISGNSHRFAVCDQAFLRPHSGNRWLVVLAFSPG